MDRPVKCIYKDSLSQSGTMQWLLRRFTHSAASTEYTANTSKMSEYI